MKKIYRADVINDLTAFKGMPNASVIVLGGSDIGDDAGGNYYWNDTSTDPSDGFNIIEVDGIVIGRWIRLNFLYFDNGITRVDSTVKLGGGLFEHTTIDLLGNTFTLETTGVILPTRFNITPHNNLYSSSSWLVDTGSGFDTGIIIDFNGVTLETTNDRYISLPSAPAQPIAVNDTLGGLGLHYVNNYGAANISNPRWIPDQGYNDGKYIINQSIIPQVATAWIGDGGETLRIGTNSGGLNNTFIGLYPRQATPTTRTGTIGYISAGTTILSINNSIGGVTLNSTSSGAPIDFLTTGTGAAVRGIAASFNFSPNASGTQNWSFSIGNETSTQNALLLYSALGSVTNGSKVILRTSSGTSPIVATINNNLLGQYAFGGYRDNTNPYDTSSIRSLATENWTVTAAGSKLEFYTTPNTTLTQTLRISIDNDGKILSSVKSSASAPTTTDIPAGYSTVWKNTTSGELRLYSNDGGTLKSVLLT